MIRHNLLSILRSFKSSRITFLINLLGLSASLSMALLIYLWVVDELSFDRFFPDHDRIFQVMEHKRSDNGIITSGNTPDFLASVVASEMPEVEIAAVATPVNFFPLFTVSDGDTHVKASGKFVDRNFLEIFHLNYVKGDEQSALSEKYNIAISESLAARLSNNDRSMIGRNLVWDVMGTNRNVTVKAVFSDLPANSSEHFDFLVTFDSFRDIMGMDKSSLNWDNGGPFATYLKISENSNQEELDRKFRSLLGTKTKNAKDRTLFIAPYISKYLHGQYENGQQTGGRIEYVVMFTIIAIFIVLIACINFTNLATAKAISRAKGSGIRKAIGAQRRNLIVLYLSESMLITFMALVIALILSNALLTPFNLIAGKNLVLVPSASLVIGLSAIFIFTSVVAGGYPALYLSGFNPAKALRGQLSISPGGAIARKGLVVFQFVMSMAFIAGVIVVYEQIQFISNRNLGYDKERVIYFEADGMVAKKVEPFLSGVRAIDGVVAASGLMGNLVSKSDAFGPGAQLTWEDKIVAVNSLTVNYDLLELLGIELKEGRGFSRSHESDLSGIVLNEAAVDALGIKDPVGKIIGTREVLGVVRNFHYQSLHETVKPMTIRLEPAATTTIMIRLQPDREQSTLDKVKQFHDAFNPGYTFQYTYLDSDFQAQHASENRVAVLSSYAAGLTIIISCLGLFGLVVFTTERRRKEISIRKLLGSGEFSVIVLLSTDFMKTVLIAVILAMPLSYLASRAWLESFAFRIELNLWYFIVAAVSIVLIALSTVLLQTWNAARANPAIALKSE